MNAAPAQPQSLWTNEDPRLHLLCWDGDGPPLLLAHGMAGHSHWWSPAAPALAGSFRPVGLDFHGHGDSQWLSDGGYDTERFLADIESARHALGWGRMILAGHSLGARVALEYARRHPDRLIALVAVDFLADAFEGGLKVERVRSRPQPLYADEEAMLQNFRLQPRGTLLTPDELRALGRKGIKKTPEGWTWKYDWRGFNYRCDAVWPVLPEVRVPTLVVRGEHSTVFDREAFARTLRSLPRALGVEIPRAHHHVPLDAPAELAAEIARFVSGLPGDAP